MADTRTEADAIAEIVRDGPMELPDAPYGLVAMGGNVVDYRDRIPLVSVEAVRRADTADAFSALVTRLKEETTVVFADLKGKRFEGVIDYSQHERATRDEHRVVFAPDLHPDWIAWSNAHGKWLDQVSFAEFVEERMDTIVDPPGADLLEMSQNLRGKRDVEFQSSQRLADGQTQLRYTEKLTTRGAGPGGSGLVTVPANLTIETPVFRDGDVLNLEVFLRFRIDSTGSVTFCVRIKNADDVIPMAFEALTKEVTEGLVGTGVPVYAGWRTTA